MIATATILRRRFTASTSCFGVMLLLAIGMLPAVVAAADPVWFEPRGCEFKVEFPQAPKIAEQYVQGAGYVSTASGGVDGGVSDTIVLVAESAQFDPAALVGVDRNAFLMDRCRQYAQFNGLEHVEYTVEAFTGANALSLRGGKKAGGVPVLYLCKVVLGSHSILMIRAGGAASGFPEPGIVEFVTSVRRQ
jgi:hypothetical protein